ncbi:MAG TPA: nitrous oxide reductase accessory protein NosL [Dongiaceae bacterium]
MKRVIGIAAALILVLAACSEESNFNPPAPMATTPDATGRYCGMLLAEHAGPKGQILLKGVDQPVWFTSVRDTFTFLDLPEEPKEIAAIYVSDMGKAPSWEKPGDDNWILAEKAVYVVESDRVGGMGGAEAIPFGEEASAREFIVEHGGRIVPFEEATIEMAKERRQ